MTNNKILLVASGGSFGTGVTLESEKPAELLLSLRLLKGKEENIRLSVVSSTSLESCTAAAA